MTTIDRTLIQRLRDTASKGVSVWGDLQMEAAKEIEILTAERGCRRWGEAAKVCDAHTVDDTLVGVGISKSCASMVRALIGGQTCTSDEWLSNCPQSVRDLANKIKKEST